jgi:hypothetical protein
MGLDPFGPAILFSFVVGLVLVPLALLLSVSSWLAGRGALMEATAILAGADKK